MTDSEVLAPIEGIPPPTQQSLDTPTDTSTTSSYQPPSISSSSYRTLPVPPASLWQLFRANGMMFFLVNSWIGSIAIPIVIFPILLYLRLYITLCIMVILLILPHIIKLSPNTFVQWLIFKYSKCFMAYHTHQFTIYYLDGAYDLLNRHTRAAFLDYSPWKRQSSNKPSEQEAVVPILDMKTLSHIPPSSSPSSSPSSTGESSGQPQDLTTTKHSHTDQPTIASTDQSTPTTEHQVHPKPLLLCFHPHGVFCVGMFLGGICNNSLHAINSSIRYLVASALTVAPYFHYILDWIDICGPASNQFTTDQMKLKKDIALLPGGFEEASLYTNGKHIVYIKHRKGFIKYALQYGYDIIPVYSFGDEKSHINLLGSAGKSIKLFLNKHQIPCVFPWGKYLFSPFTSHRFDVIYGKPLLLPHIETPSKHEVDYWHTQYVNRLQDIFNENKVKVGQPDAELIIH